MKFALNKSALTKCFFKRHWVVTVIDTNVSDWFWTSTKCCEKLNFPGRNFVFVLKAKWVSNWKPPLETKKHKRTVLKQVNLVTEKKTQFCLMFRNIHKLFYHSFPTSPRFSDLPMALHITPANFNGPRPGSMSKKTIARTPHHYTITLNFSCCPALESVGQSSH